MSDDERDEDGDGLTNYDETGGPMSSATWWSKCYTTDGAYPIKYAGEKPYPIVYAGTEPDDRDSDGDKVRDGADDQDHDDVPNLMELSRNMAGNMPLQGACGATGSYPGGPATTWVSPFNPCLPFDYSRTCPVAIPFGGAWAPFDRTSRTYFVWQ